MRPKLPLSFTYSPRTQGWIVFDAEGKPLGVFSPPDGEGIRLPDDLPIYAALAAFIVAACNMVEKVEALAKDWEYRAGACEDTATVSAQMGGGLVDIATTRAIYLREGANELRDILKEVPS